MSFASNSDPFAAAAAAGGNVGNGGGGGAVANGQGEMEDPIVPDAGEQYDPKDMAMIHFLIYAGQLLRSFHKGFPTCLTTTAAAAMYAQNFPRAPLRIDPEKHLEMTYKLNPKQTANLTTMLKQFHDCMHAEITMNKGTPQETKVKVMEFFKRRDNRAWLLISQKVAMVKALDIPGKLATMKKSNVIRCWKFIDLLYGETKKFVACRHLESMIPEQMKEKLQSAMAKTGGPSPDNPMGMSPEDIKTFMTEMDPNMMGSFISNVFSKPDMLQQTMQSVGDLDGGEGFSKVTDMMANLFKPPVQ